MRVEPIWLAYLMERKAEAQKVIPTPFHFNNILFYMEHQRGAAANSPSTAHSAQQLQHRREQPLLETLLGEVNSREKASSLPST